jgi:competence protein ComFA
MYLYLASESAHLRYERWAFFAPRKTELGAGDHRMSMSLQTEYPFVLYTWQGTTAGGQPLRLHLVSPVQVFEQWERQVWEEEGELSNGKAVLEVHREQVTVADRAFQDWPQASSDERQRWFASYGRKRVQSSGGSARFKHPGIDGFDSAGPNGFDQTNGFDRIEQELYVLVANMLVGRDVLLSEVISAAKATEEELSKKVLKVLQYCYLHGDMTWASPISVEPLSPGVSSAQKRMAPLQATHPYCRRCFCGLSSVEKAAFKQRLSWPSASIDRSFAALRSVFYRWIHIFAGEEKSMLVPAACSHCHREDCLYCPQCLQMGKIKSCQPFMMWSGQRTGHTFKASQPVDRQPERRRHDLDLTADPDPSTSGQRTADVAFAWSGQLTAEQTRISDELQRFVRGDYPQRECLLWAVCGSGKTEMLFAAVHDALNRQQRILITSPRKDVITELAPRLSASFPQTEIAVLHGESTDKWRSADLYVATTHQVLRFRNAYDLIIVDEEDAFPFHHDVMLPVAVQKAMTCQAKCIYVTATPTRSMQRRAEQGEILTLRLNRRYHGQPLPVPHWMCVGRWREAVRSGHILTPLVQYVLHLYQQGRYGYLFVPHIDDLETVDNYLRQHLLPYVHRSYSDNLKQVAHNRRNASSPESTAQERGVDFVVEHVHAGHPDRARIVHRFRQHEIDILLTTTILERGVTIPYSDVAVLGSDDQVFDSSALIQIAGRVGRKWEDPHGHVWFMAEHRTRRQQWAIRQIQHWNKCVLASGDGRDGR